MAKKILVVDDEEKPKNYVARKLRGNPQWKIDTASSEKEAIKKIANDEYDVIITDMKMKNDNSGIAVLEAAKKKDISVEVIVMTAFASINNAVEAMGKGAYGYINKEDKTPYAKLFEKVKAALKQREEPHFDVFLSYNSKDKDLVVKIATKLKEKGIKPWIDVWYLKAGDSVQDKLGGQIDSVDSAAIFFGKHGSGPWQIAEQKALIVKLIKKGCCVIPVILENCKEKPKIPTLLSDVKRVDFRDPLKELIEGIKSRNKKG